MRKRVLWIAIGVMAFSTIGATMTAILLFNAIRFDWFNLSPGTYLSAQWDDMEFDCYESDIYGAFSTSLEGPTYKEIRPNARIAPVYLRMKKSGKLYYLPELTPESFTEVTGYELKEDYRVGTSEAFLIGNNSVEFRNGRLVSFSMNPDSNDPWSFEIGPGRTGEFVTLPARRAEIHRVFGPPRKYKRYRGAAM